MPLKDRFLDGGSPYRTSLDRRKLPHGLTVTEHWQHAQALNRIDMSVKLVGRMKPMQS